MKTISLILTIIILGSFMIKDTLPPNDTLPINETLRKKLDYIIDNTVKLADSSSINSRHKSFWISAFAKKDICYLTTIADFKYYNSSIMDGYFIYRNKYITVYNGKSNCYNGLIDTSLLKKGKIPALIDYYFDKNDSIMPYPPAPHEPFNVQYEVHSSDSLVFLAKWNG